MSLLDALELIEDQQPHSPPMQMAIDEVLLRRATVPTLRLYRWSTAAISFGYFSRFEDVRVFSNERALVRRWTGGGIVMHGDDLTYSFAVPAAHSFGAASAREIYVFIHRAIAGALRESGINATLAASPAPRVSDACFANPVTADVLVEGHKVAGAAQRRCRAGLLQQGSIQLQRLPENFAREFCRAISHAISQSDVTPLCLSEARKLADLKYATHAWLTRR